MSTEKGKIVSKEDELANTLNVISSNFVSIKKS